MLIEIITESLHLAIFMKTQDLSGGFNEGTVWIYYNMCVYTYNNHQSVHDFHDNIMINI